MRKLSLTILFLISLITLTCAKQDSSQAEAILEGNIQAGEIIGPDLVYECNYGEYSISVVGPEDMTITWSCEPIGSGYIEPYTTPETFYLPGSVPEDTQVQIKVEISSSDGSTAVRTREILVADVPSWDNMNSPGRKNTGIGLASDSDLNVIITGTFIGEAVMFPGTRSMGIKSNGMADNYLCKFDSSGKLLWANSWGSKAPELAGGVDIDNAGNIYVTGSFYSTVDFDTGDGVYELSSGPRFDGFLSKFTPDGQWLWSTKWGGTAEVWTEGIVVDSEGNSYVRGYYVDGDMEFDSGTGEIYHAADLFDYYIAKFNPDGELIWNFEPNRDDGYGLLEDICLDRSEDLLILLEGVRHWQIVGDEPNQEVEFIGTTPGCYIISLSKNREVNWVNSWGSENVSSKCLDVDISGNIYIGGTYLEFGDFDPDLGAQTTEARYVTGTDSGMEFYGDILDVVYNGGYLIKFSPAGEFQWVKYIVISPDSIFWENSDSLQILGTYYSEMDTGPADLDPGPGEVPGTGNGNVISIFNSDGDFITAFQEARLNDFSSNWIEDIAVDLNGGTYCIGEFFGTIKFGSKVNPASRENMSSRDIFLSKGYLSDNFEWVVTFGGTEPVQTYYH